MRISNLLCVGALAATILGCSPGLAATPHVRDGSHDFDFFYGSWVLRCQRLKSPVDTSHDWVKFDATDEARPLPGGLGNEDFARSSYPTKGFVGMTLRLYDRATGLWRLYWIDTKSSHGDAGTPNVGRWQGNVGTFDARITYDGKPAIDRYTWTRLGNRSKIAAHFQESLSFDGGKTWKIFYFNDVIRAPSKGIAH
ncbi:MAG TPA: hypothetical protein VL176_04245 [Steroidobacteraceae bacterium]|jgi:hypothetical protein|nr:hypothetical protein [Steroidobacteraceae bacterium]